MALSIRLPRQQEFAREMGVTAQTLITWEKRGMPVAYRKGQLVFYSRKLTERWLSKQRLVRRGAWRKNRNGGRRHGR